MDFQLFIDMIGIVQHIKLFTQMKIGVFLCFILLLTYASGEALQLYSVSSSPTQVVQPSGSVRGGTTLYIKGVGFSTNPSDNKVTIGKYPCNIPGAGATQTTISCVTSDTMQSSDIYNLPINVISNGQQQSLTNEQGCFSYLNSYTPLLQALFPASSVAGTKINFFGIHRITNLGDGNRNTGDVISMSIGDALCGTFDIAQGPIKASYGETIACYQAKVQEAGKYTVMEYLTPGYSTPDAKLRRSSFLQENYHFAVLPAITSFTPNSGAPSGQQLSITGTGFSNNASQISVTVDGNSCDITSSSITQINCNLRPRDNGVTSKLSTSSSAQSNGYISGTGLKYKRYDVSGLSSRTISNLRSAINANQASIVLLEDSYRGEISTGNYYGTLYGQSFTGYFTAPVTGTYIFRGVGDDIFSVYLATNYGSVQPAASPLIYSDSYQDFNNFYVYHIPTAEASVNLMAGKSYYLEAYHINHGGSGSFRVSVQIPNKDQTLFWQTHAVQKLVLDYNNDPEILTFTQTGGTGGQITLSAVIKPVGQPSYVLSATINYNANITQFLAALNSLSLNYATLFSPYSISGSQTMYDANDTITTNAAQAYKYVWTVYVKYVRPSNVTKITLTPTFINYSGAQSFTQTTVQPHGPVIAGSFGLMIGGQTVQYAGTPFIRYNVQFWELQSSLRAIPGFQLVEVSLLTDYNYISYGATWLISFIGYNGPVPLFTVDNSFLFGGVAGTSPQLTPSEVRAYSSDLLVNPIDYLYLSTPSSQANVLVQVNGIPSVCLGNCIYTFLSSSPQVTAASISGPTMTLTLTDPAPIGYTLADVTVTLGGQPCAISNLAASLNNFQCTLPANTDGTATMTAGSYLPVVTVKQSGNAPCVASITPFNFQLSLTSLNFTSGGNNGGYLLKLTGVSFPLDMAKATVYICGKEATIKSLNNINAQIIVPPCTTGSTTLSISDGTTTSNALPFTYVAAAPPATIFKVIPQTYNPSLKGTLQIFGVGFGTNINGIRVDLANSSGKVYSMRVLTINDTYIKAGIPGGLTGKYDVQVNLLGIGQAFPNTTTVNDFTYELVVNSVTPSSGSYNGGTLVNLKGINFSPALDETLVFVGTELNWLCKVQSVNTTDILCRTPPISQYYNVGTPLVVTLTNRLMVDNTCGGSCSFSYIPLAQSPSLTSISTNTITTGSLTLSGSNLNIGSPLVILTNKKTGLQSKVTPASSSASSIVFTVPDVESGQYDVKVRTDPVGESNSYSLIVNGAITAKAPTVISTAGGRFTITGSGLPNGWPNANFAIKLTQNNVVIQPSIFYAGPTSFVVNLPSSATGEVFNLTLTTPNGNFLNAIVSSASANTPLLTITSPTAPTGFGLIQFSFSQTNLQTVVPNYVEIYSLYNPSQAYNGTIGASASGTVSFSATLTGGSYGFRFFFASYGWSVCTSTVSVTTASPTAPSGLVSSYNGGSFVLTGTGLSASATVKINGIKTQLTSVTSNQAVAVIPPFVTTETQTAYSLASPVKLTASQFTVISDTAATKANAFDGFQGTIYTSTSTGACFIGADVGSGLTFSLSRVRFFPNSKWIIASTYLIGATIQASNDQTNWVTLATIDSTVRSGWNIVQIDTSVTYRYIRFAHDSTSKCGLAELEIEGVLQTATTLASLSSNIATITYEDGSNTFTLSNSIQFRDDKTSVVTTLSQTTGNVFGNYDITLTGTNLNFDTPSVVIDGIPCAISASTATSITCTVGARLTLPASNSFVVKVGSSIAIIKQDFKYVMRWSDIRTWGTDMPPIDGDLVFVPAGMNLLVDQSTPNLKGILVQNGTLTFADESDITISTGFITVVGGKFIAGTEAKPYQNKLTFVLYGDYYGPQQPMFGNKGIGCLECFISIHGKVRTHTWTMLSTTIAAGDSTFTVQDPVDWAVGEEIVVASTSFDHNEAERRIITAITGSSITVNAPFKNMHFAGVQTYGGKDKLEMRAEVGLLTRNIKVTGDDTSPRQSYGAHLMMAGSAQNGLVGQIAYTQFTKCGQPRIIGRYCIHFHMNGDVSDSFARGNAVHDSMARVITLHGVHYLTVQYNVGYNVMGHNYFIEDGIETHNLLQYNLAISSIQVWTMLQTDISVASFWVTHPTNHFRYNHAAGGDFYGFWYEIKSNPDGPSACNDVCPIGNPLGDCHDNVAHSNVRFGLRVFKLAPRTYPCSPLSTWNEVDPWASNPGVVSTFANYTVYKNGESGLLAEFTANLVFTNFTSAQNLRSGAQFWEVYFSKDLTVFKDSVIIGQTQTNNPQSVSSARGIITPRVGNIKIDNVRFYNYPANTYTIQTCAHCDDPLLFSNSVQEVYISNTAFSNITGNRLFMNGPKRQILYDLDGTFTGSSFDGTQRTSAAVTFNYKHLSSDPACKAPSSTQVWDNSIACDSSVKLVTVAFSKLKSQSLFSLIGLKAQEIAQPQDLVPETSTSYTEIFSEYKKMDSMNKKKTYAMPYITGRIYNIWWLTGLDFDHLSMTSSYYMTPSDPAILFKFNYTLNRQFYQIGAIKPSQPSLNDSTYFVRSNGYLDENSCINGEFYHDNTEGNRTLQLCASAKNRTYFETTDVTGVYCQYLCPAQPGEFIKENFVRIWSNASQWPEGRLPLPGENVTVNGNWTILMDMDPAPCQFLTIDGDVIIQDKQDRNITAKSIWIRTGSLTAGSATSPFTHKLTIQLNGNKNDSGYVFDPSLVGSKIFVITGKLSLYGTSPATTQTPLTKIANAGDTSITVGSTSGWAVGDEIVIAPSFSNFKQYERVTITAISGTTVTFAPALLFTHYGDASTTISNSFGTLDTRTYVGHVTRNIKFISGEDSAWGYTVIVYQMWQNITSRPGQAVFSGVEFTLGGKYDTQSASLILYNNFNTNTSQTVVTSSSFSFCRSFCLKVYNQNNALITNSVFFQGRKLHIQVLKSTLITVSNNLMIGSIVRPTMSAQAAACLQVTEIDPQTDLILANNNICQGAQMNGFVFPFVPCSMSGNMPFTNNTAGSAGQNAFLLIRSITSQCLAFSGVRAYASNIGVMSSPPNTAQVQHSNYIIADCQRALGLRFGLEGADRSAYLSNSYLTQISRPSCSVCYGAGKIDCSNNYAVRLLAVTVNGESYPHSFDSGYDVICRSQTFDAKAFINNVVFENYKASYTESALSQCSGNIVFKPHPSASDLTGSHHLWNSSCINCQLKSLAYFMAPPASELGWSGGCGNISCTGRNNYFIEDHSGTFLPGGGILLANNSVIGDNTPGCTFISEINGHHCLRHDFAVLQYENIAPDFNTRIMWPVNLTYDGANFTTVTNGYREWDWIGNQPQNKRLGRFISVVNLQKIYNMTFASNAPDDMRLQIQKRIPGGNNSDWVIVKLYYPFPNSIEVSVNGVVKKPITLLDNNGQAPLSTDLCGSNKFFYKNYTVHFVVTGAANCLVRVRLTNSVQLTMLFAININSFFSSNGPTRLVDNMCAVLGITDQSRVKIVGVYTGSTQVVVHISPASASNDSQAFNSTSDLLAAQALQAQIDSLNANGSIATQMGDLNLISAESQVVPIRPVSQSQPDNTNQKIMIGVIASVVGLIVITGAIIIYLKMSANNKVTEQVPEFSSASDASHNDKAKSDEKQRQMIEVHNITQENISEVIFDNKPK